MNSELREVANFGWVIVLIMWLTILFENIFNFHHRLLTIFLSSLLALQLIGYAIAIIKKRRKIKNESKI